MKFTFLVVLSFLCVENHYRCKKLVAFVRTLQHNIGDRAYFSRSSLRHERGHQDDNLENSHGTIFSIHPHAMIFSFKHQVT